MVAWNLGLPVYAMSQLDQRSKYVVPFGGDAQGIR